MKWNVDLNVEFLLEYRALHKDVQDELLAHIGLSSSAPSWGGLARIRSTAHVTRT